MNEKYSGFADRRDIAVEFDVAEVEHCGYKYAWQKGGRLENEPYPFPDDFPTEDEILYANYDGADYEGQAWVIFEKNGKLFEVNASHCSCYGLEGGWSPEETSWEAIAMRPDLNDDRPGYGAYAVNDFVKELVKSRVKK